MKLALQMLAVAALMAVAGCGGNDKSAEAGAAKPKQTGTNPPAPAAAKTNVVAMTDAGKAVFPTNAVKDPFYPVGPKPTNGPPKPPEKPPIEVVKAALQKTFGGVFGGATERFTVLGGLPFQAGDTTVVNVVINGKPERLKVKIVRLSRNVAEVQVEGFTPVIPLTTTAR